MSSVPGEKRLFNFTPTGLQMQGSCHTGQYAKLRDLDFPGVGGTGDYSQVGAAVVAEREFRVSQPDALDRGIAQKNPVATRTAHAVGEIVDFDDFVNAHVAYPFYVYTYKCLSADSHNSFKLKRIMLDRLPRRRNL
jgi:hypothetical protein